MNRRYFQRRFLRTMLIMVLPLLIFGVIGILLSFHFISDSTRTNSAARMTQAKDGIEIVLDEMDLFVINFSATPELTTHLKDYQRGRIKTSEALTIKNLLRIFLSTPVYAKPYLQSNYVYCDLPDTKFVMTSEGLVSLPFFYDKEETQQFLKDAKRHNVVTRRRTVQKNGYAHESEDVITVCHCVTSDEIIVLNFKSSYLEKTLTNVLIDPRQLIYVLNEENELLLSNQEIETLPDNLISIQGTDENGKWIRHDGIQYLYTSIRSDRYGWKYISLLPEQVVYTVPRKLTLLLCSILIISIALSLWISYSAMKRNSAQIFAVAEIIRCAEAGEALPEISEPQEDGELGIIAQKLIRKFLESEYLKTKVSEYSYQLQTTELVALQAQMNPHFLLNTLKSMYWMSVRQAGKPNELSQMIEDLTDVLAYALQSPRKMVTLAEELRNAHSYVDILEKRYKGKIHVIWNIDSDVLDYQTIKMVLQPLIENAVYHGIKEIGQGHIVISILRADEAITLSVSDDGQGIDEKHLHQIREKLDRYESDDAHIGLYNTNKRLNITFNANASLKIDSEQGKGTTVTIRIPICTEVPLTS